MHAVSSSPIGVFSPRATPGGRFDALRAAANSASASAFPYPTSQAYRNLYKEMNNRDRLLAILQLIKHVNDETSAHPGMGALFEMWKPSRHSGRGEFEDLLDHILQIRSFDIFQRVLPGFLLNEVPPKCTYRPVEMCRVYNCRH